MKRPGGIRAMIDRSISCPFGGWRTNFGSLSRLPSSACLGGTTKPPRARSSSAEHNVRTVSVRRASFMAATHCTPRATLSPAIAPAARVAWMQWTSREVALHLSSVVATEQTRVCSERIELVEIDAVLPAVGEWIDLVVRGDQRFRNAAEQREHREIDLAMAAVDRGVEDRRYAAARRDVAPPQIAVQPCRRLGRAEAIAIAKQRVELAIEPELGAATQRPQPALY